MSDEESVLTDAVFTVTEVNRHLRLLLEQTLPRIFIEGEIANWTRHRSGHCYFSLKDEECSLRCVMFRNSVAGLAFDPDNGDRVICSGGITVYERAGTYQLNVRRMLPSGTGALQLKFEALKKKLAGEGLFDESHKLPIPAYPERIGIVTSPSGAALQDVLNVVQRRYPCRLILAPAMMQGKLAPASLVSALRSLLQLDPPPDTIIITRGGGSQEDLFVFNDEQLAREMYAATIPIISGVGHEIDFTICDFVADLRAPTPSAAAELAVPDRTELTRHLHQTLQIMHKRLTDHINRRFKHLLQQERMLHRLHPRQRLRELEQRLDHAISVLDSVPASIGKHRTLLAEKKNRLQMSLLRIQQRHRGLGTELTATGRRIEEAGKQVLLHYSEILRKYRDVLHSLSPQSILERGFAILRRDDKIIRSVEQLEKRCEVQITLSDGMADATITGTRKEED